MGVLGCRHSAQDWYKRPGDPNEELFCSECDKQSGRAPTEAVKAYPRQLPTCVMCGASLGKSLQAWMLGCCSGACAEKRAVINGVTGITLLDEFYKRIKPYWAGTD